MAVEYAIIREALRATGDNIARTAGLLAVPRRTPYDKLDRHGTESEHFHSS